MKISSKINHKNSWVSDPMKVSWVFDKVKLNEETNTTKDFDWINEISSEIPSLEDRDKVDLKEFLEDYGLIEDYKKGSLKKVLKEIEKNSDTWEFLETAKIIEEYSFFSRKSDGRYFALPLKIHTTEEGISKLGDCLYEVFLRKKTQKVFMSEAIREKIVENDFDWALDFRWSKEVLDKQLEDCKTLKVAAFNKRKKRPFTYAGKPHIIWVTRCEEWWDVLNNSDEERTREWFSPENYDEGRYGLLWGRPGLVPNKSNLENFEGVSSGWGGWSGNIGSHLNGDDYTGSEVWFVVDQENKPIYKLIPNNLHNLAKIYEEYFDSDGRDLTESDESSDFDWLSDNKGFQFFDDYFKKEYFFDDEYFDLPYNENGILIKDDKITFFVNESDVKDEINLDDDWMGNELLLYGRTTYDTEFDTDEFNHMGNYLNNQPIMETLSRIIPREKIDEQISNGEFNYVVNYVECPMFKNWFEEFRDELLEDWGYQITENRQNLLEQEWNDLLKKNNIEIYYDNNQLEITLPIKEFWSYVGNPNHTASDFLFHKLNPLFIRSWHESYYDLWSDEGLRLIVEEMSEKYNEKLEEMINEGELEDCISSIEKWKSNGFEFKQKNRWNPEIDYAKPFIKSTKHPEDVEYVLQLEEDGEYALVIWVGESESGSAWDRKKITTRDDVEEGLTPEDVKQRIKEFEGKYKNPKAIYDYIENG